MDYDAVLFDMDGVVWRRHPETPLVYRQAVADTFREFGADPDESALDAFFGGEEITIEKMRAACVRHGIEDFETFWRRREKNVSALQQEMMAEGSRVPYEDCHDHLPRLAAATPLGLVSNNQHETVTRMVEHFGFEDCFETVLGRDPSVTGFERMKPDPHYLERALAKMDLAETPSRTLYVGDSAGDLVAAHRAGMDAAFLRRPHRADYDLVRTTNEAIAVGGSDDEPDGDVVPTYEASDLRALTDWLLDQS